MDNNVLPAITASISAAVMVLITSILGPWLMARQINKNRAAELRESNRRLDESQKQLTSIEIMVDGHYTASLKSDLATTRRELVLLLHVGRMHRERGFEPDLDGLEAITTAKARIVDLTTQINAREEIAAVAKNVG